MEKLDLDKTLKYIRTEKQMQQLLIVIMLANITTMLNTSTVTISLPSYMTIFNIDINTVQWVVIGYTLPLCMMMPLSGYLCERYSYRTVFLSGILLLGCCSFACACSINFLMLVISRFFKGIAAGLIIPSTISMLYRYIPVEKQPSYLGNAVLCQSLGIVIGPTLAGLILQFSSWHVLFLINIPLVLFTAWFAYQSIPKEDMDLTQKFDFVSILEIAIGTGIILIAFTNGESWGWSSLRFICFVGIGLILLAIFIMRQFHSTHPLLNFNVLKYRSFLIAIVVQCTLSMTQGITGILSQLYLQTVRGYSPAETGLFLLVPSLTLMIGNSITNTLHKKGFARWLIISGLVFAVLGNLGLCNVTIETNIILLLVFFSLRYFGLGIVQMPLTNYGIGAIPPKLSSHASAMYNWLKQFTQVVSTNILTVLLSFNISRFYLVSGKSGVPIEGTIEYSLAATQAVNSDFFYMTICLIASLCCTFFIKPTNK